VISIHVGLDECHVATPRRFLNGHRLGDRGRERLFAKHVLACLSRASRPHSVLGVNCRDVDCIDIGVREQIIV
jgi:hypothetical protein